MSFEMYLDYLKETESEGDVEPEDESKSSKKKGQQPVQTSSSVW